jgi:hypothetical protein
MTYDFHAASGMRYVPAVFPKPSARRKASRRMKAPTTCYLWRVELAGNGIAGIRHTARLEQLLETV